MAVDLHDKAKKLALALGISFYVRDGWIYQNPPGDRVDPPTTATPAMLGHGYETHAAQETAP